LIGWIEGEILLAGEEAYEGAALLGGVVTQGALERWIGGFEFV
jgi:hypothetical protein